jgi:hypothetical protein
MASIIFIVGAAFFWVVMSPMNISGVLMSNNDQMDGITVSDRLRFVVVDTVEEQRPFDVTYGPEGLPTWKQPQTVTKRHEGYFIIKGVDGVWKPVDIIRIPGANTADDQMTQPETEITE